MSEENEFVKVELSGRVYLCKPAFIEKDASMLSAFGSVIRKISTKTGESLGSFSGHTGAVTCIVPIQGKNKVLTGSADGEIILWDHATLTEIKRINVISPVFQIILTSATRTRSKWFNDNSDSNEVLSSSITPSYLDEELYLILGSNSDHLFSPLEHSAKLVVYDLSKMKIRRHVSKINYLKNTLSRGGITISLNLCNEEHDYIVIASNSHHSEKKKAVDKSDLLIWSTEIKRGFTLPVTQGLITCISYNDASGVLVIGHESGEIVIYHDFRLWLLKNKSLFPSQSDSGPDNKESNISHRPVCTTLPVTTPLHWHAHPVVALEISADGRQAYSGGEEGVLVKWQLSADAMDRKAFIPRLGGCITNITASLSQPIAAFTLRDNSVRIVNFASLKQEWIVRALSLGDETSQQSLSLSKTKLIVEPRSGCLVCNSFPDSLQVLEPENLRVRAPYPILDYVRVSRKDGSGKLFEPVINHFVFDGSAKGEAHLLITTDTRTGEGLDPEYSLKFWCWSTACNTYRLEAQMDSPHMNSPITALSFYPKSSSAQNATRRAATASADGTVKIWQRSSLGRSKSLAAQGIKASWTCAYSFKHREDRITSIAFSYDGSVLAIAQGNIVHLWDPERVALKTSIPMSQFNESAITFLSFIEPNAEREAGFGGGKALLVAGSKTTLAVYDLLTLSLLWTRSSTYSALCAASCGTQFSYSKGDVWLACALEKKEASKGARIYEVEMVDVFTGNTVASVASSAKVISLTFRPKSSAEFAGVTHIADGLFACTNKGELFFYGHSSELPELNVKRPEKVAQIFRRDSLPKLQMSASVIAHVPGASSGTSEAPSIANKKDIQILFDESSSNIPSVSNIFDAFIKASSHSKLAKAREPLLPSDSLDSAEAPLPPQTAEQTNETRSITPATPFYSGKLQAVFDSSLVDVFRGILKPSQQLASQSSEGLSDVQSKAVKKRSIEAVNMTPARVTRSRSDSLSSREA